MAVAWMQWDRSPVLGDDYVQVRVRAIICGKQGEFCLNIATEFGLDTVTKTHNSVSMQSLLGAKKV